MFRREKNLPFLHSFNPCLLISYFAQSQPHDSASPETTSACKRAVQLHSLRVITCKGTLNDHSDDKQGERMGENIITVTAQELITRAKVVFFNSALNRNPSFSIALLLLH